MRSILNLFGRSPFALLTSHMEKVAECVHLLLKLFADGQNFEQQQSTAEQLSQLEHEADLIKNEIRNHLSKSLYLAIDRSSLLEILSIQDHIADAAEDVAVLVTLKPMTVLPLFGKDFELFLKKNIETFDGVQLIMKELHQLLESSFAGIEAKKVSDMVDEVAFKEHETDLIQHQLMRHLFESEGEMTYASFYLWQKIFETTSSISNLSEKLANRVRMTLELGTN